MRLPFAPGGRVVLWKDSQGCALHWGHISLLKLLLNPALRWFGVVIVTVVNLDVAPPVLLHYELRAACRPRKSPYHTHRRTP